MEGSYSIFPLGDSAITLDLGERIDEQLNGKALAIREWLTGHPIPGMDDIIVAYSSVTLLYDPVEVPFRVLQNKLEQAVEQAVASPAAEEEPIGIPVCYGGRLGPDLVAVAGMTGIPPEEIIHLHGSGTYRVYMIGFLPGFPYLGKIDPRLSLQRKAAPVPVLAGSVGIVGIQSCIYPLNSPGGWHIIGRIPLKLFDPVAENPIRLKTGDRVRFFPIGPGEFEERLQQGQPGN